MTTSRPVDAGDKFERVKLYVCELKTQLVYITKFHDGEEYSSFTFARIKVIF